MAGGKRPEPAARLDAAQVPAEGGQAGGQALLVPDVGQHAREGRQVRRRGRGHGQARLGHQHSQAERLRMRGAHGERSVISSSFHP